jgi:hypothetical protein
MRPPRLIRRIDDPTRHPLLAWRWKIAGVAKADATRRRATTSGAHLRRIQVRSRLQIRFNRAKYALIKLFYGEYPPHAGINYARDNRLAGHRSR